MNNRGFVELPLDEWERHFGQQKISEKDKHLRSLIDGAVSIALIEKELLENPKARKRFEKATGVIVELKE